jgi:hypothetical protein
MVQHRRVALPSLFRGHDHVAETSRADHYRAPCCHHRIALLVLTSVGWDDRCVPLRYKGGALPRGCHYQVSPAFELDNAGALCFSLQLVFGQPATSSPLPLLRHSPSKLFRRLCRQPPEEARKKTERRTPTFIVDMAQFVEMFESFHWTLVAMYLYIVGGVCLLLVFHVHIHRPLPHELC